MKFFRFIFSAFISLLLMLIIMASIIISYIFIPSGLNESKIVVIKPGTSIIEISKILEQEGVVKYKYLFKVSSLIYSRYHPLKSGEYNFPSNASPYQVLQILSKGESTTYKLTIPEGFSAHKIVEILNAEDTLGGEYIEQYATEGSLMPSTYMYDYASSRKIILKKMQQEMDRAIVSAINNLQSDSPLKSKEDILILASIVEKEAGNDVEKDKIAAVFINRLNLGMKLQADPTVIYAITKGKESLGRKLSKQDLNIDSPYNTYENTGLPPGPICCPGLISIMSVVKPAQTKNLYFVANGTGGHSFANTLKEHNRNVAIYRRIMRSK